MRLIGHRGASAAAPENTLGSVRAALGAGAGFEVDLLDDPLDKSLEIENLR